MILVGKHAIVAFDEGNNVGDHVLGKRSHLILNVGSNNGTIGHHDNHGFDLAIGQKVVEDVAGSSRVGPARVGVATTMDEVEHRQLLFSLLVAGRSPHTHSTRFTNRLRFIAAHSHGTMRNVLAIGKEFLACRSNGCDSRQFGGSWSLGIIDWEAIHHKVITINTWLDIRHLDGPDAVVMFLSFNLLSPWHSIAGKRNDMRLGCINTIDHIAVIEHTHRLQCVVGCGFTKPLSRYRETDGHQKDKGE